MTHARRIGIAGAGLLGRLAAWHLAHAGHEVHVFDPAPGPQPAHDGHGAAGFTAAGMLSPLAERETADADLADWGWASLSHWARITQALATRCPRPPQFTRAGSLMVAHGPDVGAARRVLQRLHAPGEPAASRPDRPQPEALDREALHALEPALQAGVGALHAWLLPGEGHIDTVRTLQCLHDDAPGVHWHWAQAVSTVAPGRLSVQAPGGPKALSFDTVIDVRGVGARPACAVRGVRGEVIWLHAPGLGLQRPVRLLHPRHRVYIVPRPGDVVLVGASEIESEDRSPVSLRSAVELMAAAHSILPGLAEARIVRMDVNLRPALSDHRPECFVRPGHIRLNGLYRHGWLLGPALLDQALQDAGLTPLTSLTPAAPPTTRRLCA